MSQSSTHASVPFIYFMDSFLILHSKDTAHWSNMSTLLQYSYRISTCLASFGVRKTIFFLKVLTKIELHHFPTPFPSNPSHSSSLSFSLSQISIFGIFYYCCYIHVHTCTCIYLCVHTHAKIYKYHLLSLFFVVSVYMVSGLTTLY